MKSISIILIVSILLVSCAQNKICNGVEYEPCGVFTQDEKKKDVEYKRKASSVILGILFFETIIVPIYLFGFKLYEPKCKEKKQE